jgi:acetyltransferase-like isoleucine patch superfamily enzyme
MGPKERVHVGERAALANAVLNVSSGHIYIEDRVIFTPNVMLMTGRHNFINGKRASVNPEHDDGSWGGGPMEVPESGYDIRICEGSVVYSGAIIVGGVTIGAHSIVAAGAVVTKSFPEHSFIAGVPGKRISDTRGGIAE